MKSTESIHRRTFLKLITLATGGLFFFLWSSITHRNRALTSKSSIFRINAGKLGNGTYFYDEFILFLKNGKAHFFSNKCSHAGCRINREVMGELVCTCHGSKFDPETGKVLRGPAIKALKSIPHWVDAKTGETIVKF